MWNAQPVIFEDEDEESLKAEFIRLKAKHPERDAFEICQYVFRKLRDPELRANQAALIWSKDLEVLDRIDKARINGGEEPSDIADKEAKLRVLQTIYSNENEKTSDRLKALELHAQIQGEIIKAVEKKIEDNRKVPRQIVFAQYSDD